MEWTTIIVALLSTLAGGGLLRLFTVREGKQEKQLENKQKEGDVYLKLIDELQEQVEKLNIRLESKDALLQEKDDIITDLRTKLDSVRTQCSVAELLKCVNVSCQDREPKLGTRQVDVERIMGDMYENK